MAVLLHLLHLLFLHLLHLRHLEAAQLREDPHLHLNIAWQLSSTFFFTSSPTCSLIYCCSSHKIPRSICTFPHSICTCCCQPFFFLFFYIINSVLWQCAINSRMFLLGTKPLPSTRDPAMFLPPNSCFLQKRANTTFSFSVLRTFASEYDLHLAVL